MAIDYRRLRNVSTSELIAALIRDGFILDRQSGSHQHYLHSDGRRVTVTFHHPGDTFDIKTLKSMVSDQARWSEEDLKRLRVIK